MAFGPADLAGWLEDLEIAEIVSRFTVLRTSFASFSDVDECIFVVVGAVQALWPNLTPDLAPVPQS